MTYTNHVIIRPFEGLLHVIEDNRVVLRLLSKVIRLLGVSISK